MKAQYEKSPGVAEGADERVRRRPELLPLHAPEGEAPGHHAVRAVDGARPSARAASAATSRRVNLGQLEAFYGKSPAAGVARAGGTTPIATRYAEPTGSNGIAIAPVEHARGQRAAADQSAHLVLLPGRGADGQRRGPECLRRGRPGASSSSTRASTSAPGWMHTSSGVDNIDEYLETIVKKGDALFYQVRRRGAAAAGPARSPCPTRPAPGMAQKDVHGLPHASRAHRPRGGRQVGERPG